jgi:hypothetical protein
VNQGINQLRREPNRAGRELSYRLAKMKYISQEKRQVAYPLRIDGEEIASRIDYGVLEWTARMKRKLQGGAQLLCICVGNGIQLSSRS